MAWDVTRWAYDTVTGLCMSKTYADGADNGTATNEAWAVGGESAALVRELDEQGRLVALAGRDGAPSPSATSAQRYTYDTDGRLAAVSNAEAVVTYAYTPDGRDAGYTLTLANGTTFARSVVRDSFRRDLVARIENRVNGTPVESLAYAYDALARPVSRNGDAFGYNARGEVVFSRGDAENAEEAYAYDHIGNAVLAASGGVTNAYAANALNQYASIRRASVSPCETIPLYDADGNLTGCGPWAFSYDAANRLVTVSSNGVLLVTNFYDAQSRRVRKATSEATTTYIYDGWNLVEERVAYANGTTSTIRYCWGKDLSGTLQGAGGIGGLLYLTVDGAIYIPCYDNIGNITCYLDANGNIVAQYSYDAFGKTIAQSGPRADLFRHRFSTKCLDAETGLYYYGYRFYVPSLMRWLNRDPIEESGGLNLYGFCRNNAICMYDKDGRAYFIKRRLDYVPWIDYFAQNAERDVTNQEAVHEQLIFEDGKTPSDIGYFSDSTTQTDSVWGKRKWVRVPGRYNDCVMRKAVKMVNPLPYSLLGDKKKGIRQYNCQDYADALRSKYNELIRDKKIRCECGLSAKKQGIHK